MIKQHFNIPDASEGFCTPITLALCSNATETIHIVTVTTHSGVATLSVYSADCWKCFLADRAGLSTLTQSNISMSVCLRCTRNTLMFKSQAFLCKSENWNPFNDSTESMMWVT